MPPVTHLQLEFNSFVILFLRLLSFEETKIDIQFVLKVIEMSLKLFYTKVKCNLLQFLIVVWKNKYGKLPEIKLQPDVKQLQYFVGDGDS